MCFKGSGKKEEIFGYKLNSTKDIFFINQNLFYKLSFYESRYPFILESSDCKPSFFEPSADYLRNLQTETLLILYGNE